MKHQIVIKQKMSGTGSIYDLESDLHDRVIDMAKFEYAVILPAYYGTHTRHKSFGRALQQYNRMSNMDYCPSVYDREGNDVSDLFSDNRHLSYY